MVPQGPTGLGHLKDGNGSIKDLSQLPEYKPEPGFEDFDYNPHKEGAGEKAACSVGGQWNSQGNTRQPAETLTSGLSILPPLAGDDYFAALSGKSEGSGGRKMEMFSGRFGKGRSLVGGKEGSQKGGLTESLVG